MVGVKVAYSRGYGVGNKARRPPRPSGHAARGCRGPAHWGPQRTGAAELYPARSKKAEVSVHPSAADGYPESLISPGFCTTRDRPSGLSPRKAFYQVTGRHLAEKEWAGHDRELLGNITYNSLGNK